MAKKSLEDRIMDWFFSKVNAAMSHVIKPDMKVENVGCLTQDEIRTLKQKYGIKGVILDIDELLNAPMDIVVLNPAELSLAIGIPTLKKVVNEIRREEMRAN